MSKILPLTSPEGSASLDRFLLEIKGKRAVIYLEKFYDIESCDIGDDGAGSPPKFEHESRGPRPSAGDRIVGAKTP